MTHNKSRSGIWLGEVDWNDPQLNSLLQKAEGWKVDNRAESPPHEVKVKIGGQWGASDVEHPALLAAEVDGALVLVTRVPLPHGEHVQVIRRDAGTPQTSWAVVVEGREGQRAEDRARGLYLNWLRAR